MADQEARIAALSEALRKAEERIAHLENIAHIDELTGVLNRRGFMRELDRAIAYSTRYGVATCIVFMDLDGFKQVNDGYGHGAGDLVLAQFARLLKQNLRASDSVGRIGGDEFATILMHTDPALAQTVVDAFRRNLRNSPVRVGERSITVDFSAGMAPIAAGESAGAILDRADRHLYAAKLATRSRAAADPPA